MMAEGIQLGAGTGEAGKGSPPLVEQADTTRPQETSRLDSTHPNPSPCGRRHTPPTTTPVRELGATAAIASYTGRNQIRRVIPSAAFNPSDQMINGRGAPTAPMATVAVAVQNQRPQLLPLVS